MKFLLLLHYRKANGKVYGLHQFILQTKRITAVLWLLDGASLLEPGDSARKLQQAMIDFGFEQMGFHRIWAEHWAANPASGRVMEKCGMRKESILVEKELRNGEYRDIVQYAILRQEWEERKTDPPLEIQTYFC